MEEWIDIAGIPYLVDGEVATELSRLTDNLAELLDWCKRHYAAEEGPGETDRPQFIELRALLERMK